MKIQDFFFVITFIFLLNKRNPRLPAAVGVICLFIAMPLFAKWVFFTAERLTWYAASFFLLSTMHFLIRKKNKK